MIPLDHLERLMGPYGLLEHAEFRRPRPEHGYCTDDNARALVVTAGLDTPAGKGVFLKCRDFVTAGWSPEGWHNRMSYEGDWLDDVGPEDSQGRVVWGLGTAARHHRLDAEHLALFERACTRPLSALRSVAYAVLGAAAALGTAAHESAVRAMARHAPALPPIRSGPWPWPEDRLTYDNARIPQALMLAGDATGDSLQRNLGLHLLEWLVEIETGAAGYSFTPVGGRGPGESRPAFDQQPIEAWAMAEACETAAVITGEAVWWDRARRAVDWFGGHNDGGVPLYDPHTGAGYDGLEEEGVNQNCGAESTLAALGAQLVGGRLPGSDASAAAQ